MSLKNCSIGENIGTPCHLKSYSRNQGIQKLDDLDLEEREIIWWRSGLSILNVGADICLHHKHKILKRYVIEETQCCDPFHAHTKKIKGGLAEIKLELAKHMIQYGLHAVPGYKLCPSCQKKVCALTQGDPHESILPQDDQFTQELDDELAIAESKEDEVQGYHWNQQQCTLHPIVLYHKFEDAAQFSVQSLCFISNDLDHDVNFVYKVIFETVAHIKQLSSQLKSKSSYWQIRWWLLFKHHNNLNVAVDSVASLGEGTHAVDV
eukprot:gene7366-13102_t